MDNGLSNNDSNMVVIANYCDPGSTPLAVVAGAAGILRFCLAVETGSLARKEILSQNLLCVAVK